MIICDLDIETTGLEVGDHRLIQFYGSLWNFSTGAKLEEIDTFIDPQRSIPTLIQNITGITPADVAGAPVWDVVAPQIRDMLARAEGYVWHNGDWFDGPFLDYEFKRIGLAGLPQRPSTDTMKESRWATADGKSPRLGELAFAMSVPYDKALAHKANYDVDVMRECFKKGVAWGWYGLPGQTAERFKVAA